MLIYILKRDFFVMLRNKIIDISVETYTNSRKTPFSLRQRQHTVTFGIQNKEG